MRAYSFEVSSILPVPPSAFWASATFAAVNAELAPWVRMTAPAAWRARPLHDWPAGEHLFRSWILLFGFLPVDLHDFFLENITPDVGFAERSTSAMNRIWDHDREVLAHADGCRVTDRVRYESRLPLAGALLLPVYRAIFSGRHRYLRRRYHGSAPSA